MYIDCLQYMRCAYYHCCISEKSTSSFYSFAALSLTVGKVRCLFPWFLRWNCGGRTKNLIFFEWNVLTFQSKRWNRKKKKKKLKSLLTSSLSNESGKCKIWFLFAVKASNFREIYGPTPTPIELKDTHFLHVILRMLDGRATSRNTGNVLNKKKSLLGSSYRNEGMWCLRCFSYFMAFMAVRIVQLHSKKVSKI